jgi:hypothetical protein
MNKITTFEEYSCAAASTQMESCKNENYLRFGLISEVGELCAIFKRAIRGDFKLEDKREDILLELGDICWYLDRLWHFSMSEFCPISIRSLASFKKKQLKISSLRLVAEDLIHSTMHFGYSRTSMDAYESILSVSHIAGIFDYTLADVLTANVEKLAKRKERGMIQGSGDHRGETNMAIESCPGSVWLGGISLAEACHNVEAFQSALHSEVMGGYPDDVHAHEPDAPYCGCDPESARNETHTS